MRRRRSWLTFGSVGAVLAVVAVLVVVKVTTGSTDAGPATPSGVAPASLVSALASVPAASLDPVAAGTAGAKPFTALPVQVKGAASTRDGLPRVLYVGADYCPYCAAERWPLVVALSRFGAFHHLGVTTSSAVDIAPNTPTLSFHGARFTSSLLAFDGFELATNQLRGDRYAPLDTLNPADDALFKAAGARFPYVNFGGRYVLNGASYDPGLLAGRTRAQIAAALRDPASPVARAIGGTANVITAALCRLTGQQPAAVCTSPGVRAGAARLAG